MRRNSDKPLKKCGINLYQEDWEKLQQLHPTLGSHRVIRMLVHEHIRRVEEKAAQVSRRLSQQELDDIL